MATESYLYHGIIWLEDRIRPPSPEDIRLDGSPFFSGIFRYAVFDFDDPFSAWYVLDYFAEQLRGLRSFLPPGASVDRYCTNTYLQKVADLIYDKIRERMSSNPRRTPILIGLLFGAVKSQEDFDQVESAIFSQPADFSRPSKKKKCGSKSEPSPAAQLAVRELRKGRVERGSEEEEVCVVCQGEISDMEEVTYMPCDHEFHEECIKRWLSTNNTCPVCRFPLPTENDIRL